MDDWQGSLGGVTFGAGTDYLFGDTGIDGLGVPAAKSADTDLVGQDGGYAAPDFMGVRQLSIHFTIVKDDAATALAAFDTLAAAWEPVTADVDLHLQIPGRVEEVYTGRPRGLEADMTRLGLGVIDAIGDFRAMSPRAVPA